jgi:hypothetical protein
MLREFECPSCGHKFEELQKVKITAEEAGVEEVEKIECPKCDAEAKPVGISLSMHGKNSSWPVK